MYACILIPRELSLVLTLHPNPVHVLEMSATVWSNAHLSPGTVFYPDEGEVRLDRLDNRTVLRDDDVRRVYGCYDAIMNINGQEVRHCNWVRFVKMTNDPESANVISSKVRGQAFYQVTRPIKPNEEIVVLFHLTAERSLYDRMTSSPFASHSPTLAPHPLYSDMQTPFVPRPADDKNTSMLTSTPISMATARRNSLSEGLQGQRRSLTFGSSSSSSSSLYASPLIETPNNTRQKKRNIPHESSFTSPMFTSSSSSRETTASEDQSREVTVDASSTKGDDDRPEVMVSCPKRELEETSRKDDDESVKEEEITAEDSDDVSGELKIDEDDVSDDAIDHGTTKTSFVDSTNGTYSVNEDSKKRDTVINDANTATSGAESVKEVVDDVSNVENPRPSLSEPVSPSPVPAETTGSAPEGQDQVTSSTNLYQHSVSHGDHHHSSEAADHPSKLSVANSQSGLESRTEISVSGANDHSPSSVFGDDRGRSHSLSQSGELNLSRRGDVRASETENIFSSPNETRPFPTKFRGSPTSIRSLDLPSTDPLGHPPVKRCRERTWWPCDVCGKKFDRPSLLKRHTRTHTGEKPHACDVCGKAFSTSSSLNTHRRIHSGEKPHQCKICGKRFTASSNLYYHRMTHNKEKPHKCDLCSKSFPTPGDLRSHMYIHNGSWPFRCDVCNRGFSKQTNLKNHMLLHSGDKPHECPRCGKKFALSCNLKTHLKTHENSDSSDCTECMKCGAALENPAELRDNMCKRCLDSTRRVYPKTSSTSSSKQRHTDFSISKLTSTDDNKTDGDNSDVRPEKPFPLMMPSMTSGKMKTMTSTGFVTSIPQEVPPMYRQFFTTAFDQARWFVPPGSPHLLPSPCIPGTLKQPSAFQSGSVKSGDGQTPQPAMNKLATPSPAHPVLPSFITPDMMSLRGGGVYSSGIPALPPGFPLHPGTAVWGSHVIAQGF